MVLHDRKRGDVWHCRGSVRIGYREETGPVRQFSTGCTSKAEAEAVGAAEEARIRGEFLDTGTVIEPVRVITIHDCILAYRVAIRPPPSVRCSAPRRIRRHGGAGGMERVAAYPRTWPRAVARWRSTLLAGNIETGRGGARLDQRSRPNR